MGPNRRSGLPDGCSIGGGPKHRRPDPFPLSYTPGRLCGKYRSLKLLLTHYTARSTHVYRYALGTALPIWPHLGFRLKLRPKINISRPFMLFVETSHFTSIFHIAMIHFFLNTHSARINTAPYREKTRSIFQGRIYFK